MTTPAVAPRLDQAARFYQASVGKKVLMAVSGVVLFGFVVVHLLGNLLVFLGPERLNAYAAFLRANPLLVWGTRLALLAAVVVHVTVSIEIALLNRSARPVAYNRKRNVQAGYASRTMMWSGPIILAFVIYHLLHFTFGTAHPSFRELDVYHNVISGFRVVPVSAAYLAAMLMLGLHLQHGLWSLFQSLGVSHPRLTPLLRRFAWAAAVLIVAGNISIPLAVLAGLVGF
jgi:succinate dehydrogenase / fumarate reductase cytochrome b subunit